jgi:cytochrome c-type biogenesis protein CcmH/NrfF
MLKLLTLVLWVGPALLLFLYLLWISKGPPRLSGSDGQQEAKSQKPFAEEGQSTGDQQVGRRQRG